MSSDGGEVAIKFTSQQQEKLWNDIARTVAALGELQGKGEEMAATTGKTSASLRRFAEAVKASQSTPDSRLADEMAKIESAVKATLLTEQEAAAARTAANERYQKETQDATGEVERFAEAQRRIDETPLDRLRQKTELLNRAVRQGKLDSGQAAVAAARHQQEYQAELSRSQRSQRSLGAGAVAAGSIVADAWRGALSAVQRFSGAMREEHAKALAAQQQAGGSLGMLAQISDSPEQMQQLSALARDLVRTGAAQDVGAGSQMVFDLANSNALDQVGQLRQLAEPGVIRNLPMATTAANAVRNAMGGDVGSITDIIAKSLKAAQFSSANAEQLAAGAARAGSNAKTQGMSVDELLAATGIVGDVRGSAEEGGTRLASLLRGMEDDPDARGKSLAEAIRAIQARNLPPEELTKQLTAEGADAFRILAVNLQKLDEVTRATAEQVTAVTIAEKRRIALSETSVQADMIARQEAGQQTLMREAEGRVQQMVETAINAGELERRTGGRGGLVTRVAEAAAPAGKGIGVLDKLGPAGLLAKLQLRAIGGLRGDVASAIDAMIFGDTMRGLNAVPGSAMPEAIAKSDRTASPVAEALLAAIKERDAENARFAEQVRSAGVKLESAAAALERAATRRDNLAAPRREAAAAHGGG